MSIKKQLKREKTNKNRIVLVSIIIMIAMPYMVLILNNEGLFEGWEIYFAYLYAAFVDLLLLYNILRINSDRNYEFYIENRKLKIKEGAIRSVFSIPLDKILYVDVLKKSKDDFEALVIIEKGKRNRSLIDLDENFIKSNKEYKDALRQLSNMYPNKEFYTYTLKKTGSKKYYYLYMLYKNTYNAMFSTRAMEYVKRFTDEYNLS